MSHIIQRLSVAALAAVLTLIAAPAVQAKVVCGGAAGDTCKKNQYCFHSKGTCRTPGAQGACKQRPDVCTKEYVPVCGCDGKTYGNKCMAAAAGASVLHDGKCSRTIEPRLKAPARPVRPVPERDLKAPRPGRTKRCGGIAGISCAKGQYCYFRPGSCRIADVQGVCRTRPQGCTREYRPVCGCDGKTYPTACVAASRGVSVLHTGKCKSRHPRRDFQRPR